MLDVGYGSDSGDEQTVVADVQTLTASDIQETWTDTALPMQPDTSTGDAIQVDDGDSDEAPEEQVTSRQPVAGLTRKQRRTKSKNAAQRKKKEEKEKEKTAVMAEDQETTVETSDSVKDGFCVVCKEVKGKYKCPRCLKMTCSLPCSKSHRDNHPTEAPKAPKKQPTNVFNPAAITPSNTSATPHPFSFLDNCPQLTALFERYPCLPDVLLRISDATKPPTGSSQPPAYAVPEHKRLEKKLWDKGVGEEHGKAALRMERARSDEEGEAIRAYSELVVYLMGDIREIRKRKMREEGELYEQLAGRSGGPKKSRF